MMKWIFQGLIVGILLVQSGCRSTTDEAIAVDGGAPLGTTVADSGAKPKKARRVFGRKDHPEVEQVNEPLLDEGAEVPFGEAPGEDGLAPGESTEILDSTALRRAKQHYELGDYDFAGEELRSIPSSSPSYDEAQRLLLKLQQ